MLIYIVLITKCKKFNNVNDLQVMDGCHSKVVNMVTSVPRGSVLGLQLFIQYTVKFSSYFKTGFVDSTFEFFLSYCRNSSVSCSSFLFSNWVLGFLVSGPITC